MADSIPVSAVVMTRNEERNLGKCLQSLEPLAEVFVVDSRSEDATCAIAEAQGARVVQFDWNGRYPKKKQWCLENLPFSHDWVLFLDADEELSPELTDEIAHAVSPATGCAGYFVGLDYVFLERVLRHGRRMFKLVLLDRHRAHFVDYPDLEARNMWEVEGHYQPVVEGPTKLLHGRILHEDHDSLFHYFDRHNRYSDWEAVLRTKRALVNSSETQLGSRRFLKSVFDGLPFKGALAFVDSYVVRLGFLDGRAGLHFALARAFYYWQIGLKTKERLVASSNTEGD